MTTPQELIQGYFEGSLNEGEADALRAWLAADPAHVDQFAVEALIHAELCEVLGDDKLRDDHMTAAVEGSSGKTPVLKQDRAAVLNKPQYPRDPTRARRLRRRFLWERVWLTRGMAAAIAVLAVSLAWVIFGHKPSTRQLAQGPDSSATGGVSPAASQAAVVPVELPAGFTRLTLDGNVQILVEGPAEYSVLSTTRLRLSYGRLTAVVPHSVSGFTVVTPEAEVTDLGTEFGVIAGRGFTEAEVFSGRVAVVATPTTEPAKQVVDADQAYRVDPAGKIERVEADPALFTRVGDFDKRNIAGFERWSAYSRELRRDPSLVLYYTLDDAPINGRTVLPNRAEATAGQYDLSLLALNAPSLGVGRWPNRGAALEFDPTKQQRLLLESYPPAREGRITVFAWVYAASSVPKTWANIAANWGSPKGGQFHLSLWENGGDLSVKTTQADGRESWAREGKPFPIGRWCHVGFVVDRATLHLYRDGIEVASTPSRGLVAESPLTTLGIGFKSGDDGRTPAPIADRGFWDGKIDELAIFHRAISPAEISAAYEAGRAGH